MSQASSPGRCCWRLSLIRCGGPSAMRTRMAAKRALSFPFVPVRQLMRGRPRLPLRRGSYALGAAAARTAGINSAHRPTNIPACCVLSRRRLEIENLFLRHQLNIALRRAPHHLRLRANDQALLVWMTWLWPSLLGLSRVVQPDTILRWHRAGFRAYWRWKSRGRPGRPRVSCELRELIQRMSKENPLWGAPASLPHSYARI